MGSKALLVLVMFLATILLISAEIASKEKDEKFDERDGMLAREGVDESKYFGGGFGPRGGYGYGYPWRGGYGYGYPWRRGYGYGYPWGRGYGRGFCGPFSCRAN